MLLGVVVEEVHTRNRAMHENRLSSPCSTKAVNDTMVETFLIIIDFAQFLAAQKYQ